MYSVSSNPSTPSFSLHESMLTPSPAEASKKYKLWIHRPVSSKGGGSSSDNKADKASAGPSHTQDGKTSDHSHEGKAAASAPSPNHHSDVNHHHDASASTTPVPQATAKSGLFRSLSEKVSRVSKAFGSSGSSHSTPGHHQDPAAKPEGGSKLSRAGSRISKLFGKKGKDTTSESAHSTPAASPQAPSGVKRATSLMAKRVTKPLTESKLGRSVSARISSSRKSS